MSPARRPSNTPSRKKPPRSNPAAHVEFRPRNQVRGSNPRPKGPLLRPKILGEDDGVVIVDKPAGMITADKDPQRDSALLHVKKWLKAERPGARAWVVHRLDKDASGLLLFASTPTAYTTLKEDIRSHRVQREYVAVVYGIPDAEVGQEVTLTDTLLDGPERRVVRVARPNDAQEMAEGRPAVTHARVLARGKGRALVALRLETGRRHQLRVQLAHSGHPILGDRLYGPDERDHGKQKRDQRLCLHATRLTLHHPVTGQKIELESPPPPRFYTLVGQKSPHLSADSEQAEHTGQSGHAEQDESPATPKKPEPRPTPTPSAATATGWDHVAAWYDKLVGEGQSDHHSAVIVPGALRLLDLKHGERLLDVACGEGVLARAAAQLGARVTGVDASGRLIDAAQKRAGANERYTVGDAQQLDTLGLRGEGEPPFDAVSCVMALMNIDSIEAVFRGVRALLGGDGRFVAVVLHPAFRAPGQTSWQWDEPTEEDQPRHGRRHDNGHKQYRRVDGYLTPYAHPIVMNPGAASRGRRPVTTTTHHRPMQSYIAALARCGFAIDALEEWPSQRTSEPGPRADEENRARREIPLFLAIRARVLGAAATDR